MEIAILNKKCHTLNPFCNLSSFWKPRDNFVDLSIPNNVMTA